MTPVLVATPPAAPALPVEALAAPPATAALPAPASIGAFAAPGAVTVHRDAIAEAKHEWQQACAEGASSARVLRLYEHYRDLVIARVAAAVAERPANRS